MSGAFRSHVTNCAHNPGTAGRAIPIMLFASGNNAAFATRRLRDNNQQHDEKRCYVVRSSHCSLLQRIRATSSLFQGAARNDLNDSPESLKVIMKPIPSPPLDVGSRPFLHFYGQIFPNTCTVRRNPQFNRTRSISSAETACG